jgi:hypothetical protein
VYIPSSLLISVATPTSSSIVTYTFVSATGPNVSATGIFLGDGTITNSFLLGKYETVNLISIQVPTTTLYRWVAASSNATPPAVILLPIAFTDAATSFTISSSSIFTIPSTGYYRFDITLLVKNFTSTGGSYGEIWFQIASPATPATPYTNTLNQHNTNAEFDFQTGVIPNTTLTIYRGGIIGEKLIAGTQIVFSYYNNLTGYVYDPSVGTMGITYLGNRTMF